MTGFVVWAALLAGAAALLLIVPLWWRRRTATPQGAIAAPEPLSAALAAVLVVGIAVALYAMLTQRMKPVAGSTPAGGPTIESLLRATQEHPNEISGWLELGRNYLRANQWALARRSFRRADTLAEGRSAMALVGLAQTVVYENNGTETDASIELYDRALKVDPNSPQALFYTAVALMHAGELELSRARFAALLAQGPPAEASAALRRQIANLDEAIAATKAAAKANAATAIHLVLDIAPSLQGKVTKDESLFLFVRAPQGGAPLAAKRLAPSFPQQVDISAADSMIAGHTFAARQMVQIAARLSATGAPTGAAGDLYGQLEAVAGDGATHELLIDKESATAAK